MIGNDGIRVNNVHISYYSNLMHHSNQDVYNATLQQASPYNHFNSLGSRSTSSSRLTTSRSSVSSSSRHSLYETLDELGHELGYDMMRTYRNLVCNNYTY